MYLVKAKHEIITLQIEHMIVEIELLPTNIIPIINKSLEKVIVLIRTQQERHCRTWLVSIIIKIFLYTSNFVIL